MLFMYRLNSVGLGEVLYAWFLVKFDYFFVENV